MRALQQGLKRPHHHQYPHRRLGRAALRVQGTAVHYVKLSFIIKRKLSYGLHVAMTGDAAALGSWEPREGLKMQWTEGDVWVGELEVECG